MKRVPNTFTVPLCGMSPQEAWTEYRLALLDGESQGHVQLSSFQLAVLSMRVPPDCVRFVA